jgi:hypothetical protein
MNKVLNPTGFLDKFTAVSGWALEYGSGTITNPTVDGGKVLQIQLSANQFTFLTPGRSASDIRQLVKARQSTGTVGRAFGIAARVHGDASNRNSYILRALSGSSVLQLERSSGSNTLTILASAPLSSSPGTWYNFDFAVVGNKLMGTCWLAGTSRPAGWMVEATDSAYSSGKFGFHTTTSLDAFQLDLFNTTLPQAA